jgi:hypothetical protein
MNRGLLNTLRLQPLRSRPKTNALIAEQQVGSDGTMVVNALHAVVSGVADVVVASAQAGLSGGRAQALQAFY